MNLTKLVKINTIQIPLSYITYFGPNLEDLDSDKTTRGAKGTLTRFRLAEIPNLELKLKEGITQEQLQPILAEVRKVKVSLEWFDSYTGTYLTRDFYCPKPKLSIKRIDPLIYNEVEIKFKGYAGV